MKRTSFGGLGEASYMSVEEREQKQIGFKRLPVL